MCTNKKEYQNKHINIKVTLKTSNNEDNTLSWPERVISNKAFNRSILIVLIIDDSYLYASRCIRSFSAIDQITSFCTRKEGKSI